MIMGVKNTKDFYNKTAKQWADKWYDDESMLPCLREFFNFMPVNPRVLDLCCGAGYESMRIEEVIIHELLHLKMYPLDQVTESLITTNFEKGSTGYNFAYTQFFTTLEQTVEELAKCYLWEFGEDKELSFGRCRSHKSFDELYDGLKNIK